MLDQALGLFSTRRSVLDTGEQVRALSRIDRQNLVEVVVDGVASLLRLGPGKNEHFSVC